MAREVKLPSGAKLEITLASFAESKALFQAFASEVRGVTMDMSAEIDGNLIKDLFCGALESKKIEAALAPCLKRCTYSGAKITDDVFEAADAREDYIKLCLEVAKDNIQPFTKSLFAEFKGLVGMIQKLQA